MRLLDRGTTINTMENRIALSDADYRDESVKAFDGVPTVDPSNADALHSLGVDYINKCVYKSAADIIARALALKPNRAVLYVNLGEAYRNLGEHEKVENCCRIALRLRPHFPEGLNTLGLALHRLGRGEEAVAEFRRAVELRPEMAPAHNNLGLALQALGRTEEAIVHFHRALEIAPELDIARTNLGTALLAAGRPEDALEQFRDSVRRRAADANAHHNLGNALRILGRTLEARAAYLEALLLDSRLAITHFQMGLTLRQDGEFGGALPWIKSAVELEPDNVHYWKHLAELHRDLEDAESAIACWEKVVALSPADRAELHDAHIGLGCALQDDGRYSEAKEHYEAAAEMQPGTGQSHLHMGSLHEELGDMVEAECAFRYAIHLQPGVAPPYGRLAMLLRGRLPEADVDAIEAFLRDPALDPVPRCHLLFGLAHILDDRAQYSRAAESLLEANALALEHSKYHRKYDPGDHKRFVDGLTQAFGPSFFDRIGVAGSDTRRPVFIFGLPRSGTTLVDQILSSHPLVHGAGELRLGKQTFESIPTVLGRAESPIECIGDLDGTAILRLAENHLERLRRYDNGLAERIVDKMPDNYMFIGLLAALFPNGVFIHCRRDPRDVAVSCWMTNFSRIRWANDPEHLAARIKDYRRVLVHWESVLPVKLHEINYEDTVEDLERVARRLLDACGLEWDPACLRFYETRRAIRTASITQVRQPIYTKSVARWRNYQKEMPDLFKMVETAGASSE